MNMPCIIIQEANKQTDQNINFPPNEEDASKGLDEENSYDESR